MDEEVPVIRFMVDGLPVAQPRQRMRVVDRGGVAVPQNYLPRKHAVHSFKEAVRLAAARSVLWLMAHGGLLCGPVKLTLTFVMPRPKRLKAGGREPYDKKPDFDNLEKSVADALNGLIWDDDRQVCENHTYRWYAASEESPHVLVEVEPFTWPVKGA